MDFFLFSSNPLTASTAVPDEKMPTKERLAEAGRHLSGQPVRTEASAWGGAKEATLSATYSSQPGDEIRVPAFPMHRQVCPTPL